jgi:predicted lipid-binding transport protein (Tim44 family)
MYGQFDLITLIALIVAVAAILKLRSLLGHRTDDDEQRVERLKTREREAGQRTAAAEAASADVIRLPRRDHDPLASAPALEASVSTAETRIKAYPVTDPAITNGLLEIAKLDTSLDPESFLDGARRAYEMIVSAFAEGNRRVLKDLLSREVYDGFVGAISDRESRDEKVEQQFVGIKKAELVEAELKNGIASLTVRFVSELISAVKNKAGDVISGDTQTIKGVTDIWTFSRDVSTAKARSNPDWKLVATQAPN